MQTVMWQKRRILIVTIISMVLYMVLKKNNHVYTHETILPGVKATTVWEFLADFSNNKNHLIPLLESFQITEESGNYDHWKYSVKYRETLPIWPYFSTTGFGQYSIRKDNDIHIVSSVHMTCLFDGWACSKSVCDFHISQKNSEDVLYKEQIIYECPVMFKVWCKRVAEYTREDFIKNLKNYFNTKQKY